jgi:mannose-6-phosphate isomerase-like protein (cupin superfamily)
MNIFDETVEIGMVAASLSKSFTDPPTSALRLLFCPVHKGWKKPIISLNMTDIRRNLMSIPNWLSINRVVFILLMLFSAVCIAENQGSNEPYGIIKLDEFISQLPESSQKIIHDKRLLDSENSGVRVLRLYQPVPPHYHEKSDTIIYLLEGEVSVAIQQGKMQRVQPGSVLHWKRGTVHAVPLIHTDTATFLAIDVPKRDPADAVFIDKKDVEFLK